MKIILSIGVLIVVAVGSFFAQKAYINNEKQGESGVREVTPVEEDITVDSNAPAQEDTMVDSSTPSLKPSVPPGLTLDLSNRGLTKVPENTFRKTSVTALDVSGNALSGALQAEIRLMSALVSLDLGDNNFTGVPAEVGQLSKLEYLDLSNNPITGLPYELGNLKNLKVLDLQGTNYSSYDLDIIKKELSATVDIRV